MVIGTHILIITLNVKGLNAPTKRHRMAEWIQNKTLIYAVYKTHFKDPQVESERMGKRYSMQMVTKKRASEAIFI